MNNPCKKDRRTKLNKTVYGVRILIIGNRISRLKILLMKCWIREKEWVGIRIKVKLIKYKIRLIILRKWDKLTKLTKDYNNKIGSLKKILRIW